MEKGITMRETHYLYERRDRVSLYATPPHECMYLPERTAITVFLDPLFPKSPHIYSALSAQGFRRSGEHLYRPHCQACQACVPLRIPTGRFAARRTQRRVWNKNQDIEVIRTDPGYRHEHFELYVRYLSHRHSGGGMDNPSPHSYMQFLTCRWARTYFYEFRLAGQLLGVAVADQFDNGLSAIYNFFDPGQSWRSLGAYMILWEIQEARRLGLPYLYLGYWIPECRKMRYKVEYQPVEYYRRGNWLPQDVSVVLEKN
jgi:arginine-tRNA-protein transferase